VRGGPHYLSERTLTSEAFSSGHSASIGAPLSHQQKPWEAAMKRSDERAVADFLRDGGRILKLDPDIPATPQEVLDFLEGCGVSAKYFPGDPKPYLCQRRRLSLRALVELANKHRRARCLQPFTIRN